LGKTGYGADAFPDNVIGVTTGRVISVSVWGGAFIDHATGAVTTWGQGATYSSSSSSQSWYPSADTSGASCGCTTATRDMSLTNTPSTAFDKIACGGKRAGHWCCAVAAAGTSGDSVRCFGDVTGTYTPTSSELQSQGLLSLSGADAVYSISGGCDFLCVLTQSGKLGLYTHSSNQIDESSWPSPMTRGSDGLKTGSDTYIQVACGTFAAYAVQGDGTLSAWGRIFSSNVGPVSSGTDTTGTSASFSKYVQRDSTTKVALVSANSGFGHACGATPGGQAFCWGADYASQAADASSVTGINTSPVQIYPSLLQQTITITGVIYCDNQFEFYFNGQHIASDPLDFTPHQAVRVSFNYTVGDSKTFAIICQDYASGSGYEYTGTSRPQLGDGALIAEFSDGTVTTSNWKLKVITHGPTAASESAGCSSSSLGACVVEDYGMPTGWEKTIFNDSSWAQATVYTAAVAGWGRTPTWSAGQCCQPTSPVTKSDLSCCNCNSDGTSSGVVPVSVSEDQCLVPETVLGSSAASFLWSSSLTKDNKILFRYTSTGSETTTNSQQNSVSAASSSNSMLIIIVVAVVVIVTALAASAALYYMCGQRGPTTAEVPLEQPAAKLGSIVDGAVPQGNAPELEKAHP